MAKPVSILRNGPDSALSVTVVITADAVGADAKSPNSVAIPSESLAGEAIIASVSEQRF